MKELVDRAESELDERHRKSWLRARNNPLVYAARADGVKEFAACLRSLLDEVPE